jgi:hypothetical protein
MQRIPTVATLMLLMAVMAMHISPAVADSSADPDASKAETSIGNDELEQAHAQMDDMKKQAAEAASQIEALKQQAEASNEALAICKENAKQYQDKAELLTKQLEKAEATANKYRDQTGSLSKELQELRNDKATLEAQLNVAKDAKAEAAGAAEERYAGELQAAKQQLEQVKEQMSGLRDEAAENRAIVESSDVQAYLQVRKFSADTAELAAQHTSEAIVIASEYTDSASKIVSDNYEEAWKQAEQLAVEASPHVEMLHAQVVEQTSPLIQQAYVIGVDGFNNAVISVEQLLMELDAAKPYANQASWWTVTIMVGLPLLVAGFFFFKTLVLLTSQLLHKLQYAGVFFMVGATLTTHALAIATDSDPIGKLRVEQPALDAQTHFVLGVIAVVLVSLHFVTLISRDNGGKSIKSQFASMIAAVLVVVVFCHYYFLVYLKRGEPGFSILLSYSSAGHPSYTEYSLFLLALTLFTGLGLPAGFRFSTRALYIALESGFAGALGALTVFTSVDADAFAHTLALQPYSIIFGGLASVLLVVLLCRFVMHLSKGLMSGLFALLHLVIVSRVLWVTHRISSDHHHANLKFACIGLLFTSAAHTFLVSFGAEGAAKSVKNGKPTNKNAGKHKNQKK